MSNPTPAAADAAPLSFSDLGLPEALLKALNAVGYETPSPIQAQTIPPLLALRDVLGQAQTGTGKTAAFALPMLARIDLRLAKPQGLILAPTRELAIQVAEALQKYSAFLPGFQVLPIYGGQSYQPQLSALRRGVHVIVGTPGRIIDHLERGSLKLDSLVSLVLDEADEMLRMGFIDDVETILKKTPTEKQVALFSATMPSQVRRIAQTYLRDPAEVTIASKTRTASTVNQRCLVVSPHAKLDALTRILEVEPFDGMIVFARTKHATEELADKLAARGYSVAALNGDIAQQQRERTVNKLKDGGLDIIVATDVAARGLDVERVSHVINYDAPTDPESYVHRIGRTGRAGRSGEAILFVSPRERHLLAMIERTTRKHIEQMRLPTEADVHARRNAKFSTEVHEVLAQPSALSAMRGLIEELAQAAPLEDVAAALATLALGQQPRSAARSGNASSSHAAPPRPRSNTSSSEHRAPPPREPREARPPSLKAVFMAPPHASKPPFERPASASPEQFTHATPEAQFDDEPTPTAPRKPRKKTSDHGVQTYRIEVGHDHGVLPKNIVGAIANEAGLDSQFIGHIDIRSDHSLIDLPEGMPNSVFAHLKKVWVAGHQLQISPLSEGASGPARSGAPSRSGPKKSFARPGANGDKKSKRSY